MVVPLLQHPSNPCWHGIARRCVGIRPPRCRADRAGCTWVRSFVHGSGSSEQPLVPPITNATTEAVSLSLASEPGHDSHEQRHESDGSAGLAHPPVVPKRPLRHGLAPRRSRAGTRVADSLRRVWFVQRDRAVGRLRWRPGHFRRRFQKDFPSCELRH